MKKKDILGMFQPLFQPVTFFFSLKSVFFSFSSNIKFELDGLGNYSVNLFFFFFALIAK